MRVLIACEESGIVRDAFITLGHDAISCDLLPSRRPGPHVMDDVAPLLAEDWDLIVAFPPCTYLSGAGMHWTTRGLRDPKLTEDALDFVRLFLDHRCQRIALENPVGAIGTRIRRASQWIQPYQFGHDASKKTGLWLKGLPLLQLNPADYVPPRIVEYPPGSGKMVKRWANQTDSGQNKLTPGPTRARDRSETYQGIADAMAEQWTTLQSPQTQK